MNPGQKLFIHCYRGVSRSCTFCILYLMHSRSMSFRAANDRVKSIRGICR